MELLGAQQYVMVDSWFTHSLPQKGPPLKSMKSWAWDVFDTFATHAGFVHVLIDADCWVQNGSTHSHVFAALKLQLLSNRTRNLLEKCNASIY